MIRTERYKYAVYSEGERPEELFDLATDPYEQHNLALDPDRRDVRRILTDHRQLLTGWMRSTGDDIDLAAPLPA